MCGKEIRMEDCWLSLKLYSWVYYTLFLCISENFSNKNLKLAERFVKAGGINVVGDWVVEKDQNLKGREYAIKHESGRIWEFVTCY